MADFLASASASASRCPLRPQTPLSWIKRRARSLARFYAISRSEAVASAAHDWTVFNPAAAH